MPFRSAQAILFMLLLGGSAYGAKVLPVLNQPLENLARLPDSEPVAIDLNTTFGTEAIDDQVVRFTTQSSIGSLTLDFALFSNRTPGTRANFLNYVNDGDYLRSIIHRSFPGFVIQGGGYYDSDPTTNYFIDPVPTDAPITNEFGVSNTLGTVSMAKVDGDPDSATSQWFISLGDNSENLDNQNGGFTVFARITKSTLGNALDMGDRAQFPIWNAGGAFGNLPLNPDFDNSRSILETDFLLFSSIELVDIEPSDAGTSTTLSYSIVANSNPNVVAASITGDADLELDFTASVIGITTITVRATDSVGNLVEDSFTVTALSTYEDWQSANFNEAERSDPDISGPDVDTNGDGLTNLEVYLHGLSSTEFLQDPVQFSDTEIANDRYASFTFPIRNDLADISYGIQQNNDLSDTNNWSAVPSSEISRTSDGNVDTVTIRADTPAGAPSDFYRVEFIQTP